LIIFFCGSTILSVFLFPEKIYYDSRIVDARNIMPFLSAHIQPGDVIVYDAMGSWQAEVFN
jgi:hypothetical protein